MSRLMDVPAAAVNLTTSHVIYQHVSAPRDAQWLLAEWAAVVVFCAVPAVFLATSVVEWLQDFLQKHEKAGGVAGLLVSLVKLVLWLVYIPAALVVSLTSTLMALGTCIPVCFYESPLLQSLVLVVAILALVPEPLALPSVALALWYQHPTRLSLGCLCLLLPLPLLPPFPVFDYRVRF